MIRVKINGGLGNQLFQYACGRALAEDLNVKLILDTSDYTKNSLRQPLITNFLISKNVEILASKQKSILLDLKSKFLGGYKKEIGLRFNPIYTNFSKPVTLRGYFQSEKFFARHADVIRSELFFDNQKAVKIKSSWGDGEVAALHIRRGDYVGLGDYGLCDRDYYLNGISLLRSLVPNIKFFGFTDDPEWFVGESGLIDQVNLVSDRELSDLDEFSLMSSCNHFIIANSSFSWWAAWLGRGLEKKVIAPKPWFDSDKYDGSTIVPDYWIELPKRVS